MATERYQREQDADFYLLEDGSGVLLLESSGSVQAPTQTHFQGAYYHHILRHWRPHTHRSGRGRH